MQGKEDEVIEYLVELLHFLVIQEMYFWLTRYHQSLATVVK